MEFLLNLFSQIGDSLQTDFSESIFGNATPKKKSSNSLRNNTERKFIQFYIFSKLATDNLILASVL